MVIVYQVIDKNNAFNASCPRIAQICNGYVPRVGDYVRTKELLQFAPLKVSCVTWDIQKKEILENLMMSWTLQQMMH